MRTVRILTAALETPREASYSPAERVENNLDNALETLELAENFDPDVVCFPEQLLHRWVPKGEPRLGQAQPVPGPATEAIGEKARQLDAYVWLPMTEHATAEDAYYNAVVLVGRDGDVVGTYRKLRPTAGEIEYGLSPGSEVPVWETEFGRFGAGICFDLMYPELGVELSRKRTDVMFFSSHLQGEQRIAHWARDYGFHVVKSHPKTASITDPTGAEFARNHRGWAGQEPVTDLDAGGYVRFSFGEVNTDWTTFTRTGPNREAVERIQKEYPGVVYHDASSDETFALESRSSEVTVDDIEAEFDLLTYRDYLDRTGRACVAADEGSRVGIEDYEATGE